MDLLRCTLTDHLNSVRDIARYDSESDTTTVVNHLVYDAYGNVTAETNAAVDSLFLFTARPLDPDTGLQNNLNRWYDPAVGRWLSEDPIGFAAGDGNVYRYAKNRSCDVTDPTGLVACPGGSWVWVGTARGGQVIVGYYYYKAKFTRKQSLVIGETHYLCAGHCFIQKKYKVPVAYGSVSVVAVGIGLDSTVYAYAAGTASASTSEQLAGLGFSAGFSITLIAVGGSVTGGFGNTEGSAGIDIGLGISLSAYPSYTRIWSSGYQLFDEPLGPEEQGFISRFGCQQRYKMISPPLTEPTPAEFSFMIEY